MQDTTLVIPSRTRISKTKSPPRRDTEKVSSVSSSETSSTSPVVADRTPLSAAYPRDHDGETWLRGAQISDANGVVEFQSIFPGYYQGRATHWHIRIHPDYEVLPNNTYIGKTLAHTGQIFVQDDINKAVDMMYPYVSRDEQDRQWRRFAGRTAVCRSPTTSGACPVEVALEIGKTR